MLLTLILKLGVTKGRTVTREPCIEWWLYHLLSMRLNIYSKKNSLNGVKCLAHTLLLLGSYRCHCNYCLSFFPSNERLP